MQDEQPLVQRIPERTIVNYEEEIGRFIDLGLGRGVDATDLTPWLNRSAFQVRKIKNDNVIGTEEGDLLKGFVNEVESTQHLQASLRASVPASELVTIGIDSELSRKYRESQKSVGRKIITRTISFRAGFKDIDDGERVVSQVLKDTRSNCFSESHVEDLKFEDLLLRWIYRQKEEKLNKEEGLHQNVLTDYCYEFINTYSITHYVHSLELGASYYHVMSEKDYETKVSSKISVGAGQAAGAAVGTEGKFIGKKLHSEATMIGRMSEHVSTKNHGSEKSSTVSKVVHAGSKWDTDLTVRRNTMDEAVVGVKLQPISSLVVKTVMLRKALQDAIQKYIDDHQKVKCKLL